MTHRTSPLTFVALTLLLVGCSQPQGTPPRSPNNDVQPPATTTGNGEVLGADRVSPAQKLEEGPQLDTKEGLKPAERPPGD